MASVTKRIASIKQPRGGYIKPSSFESIILEDNKKLNEEENIHSSVIGMAVDYLTRYSTGANLEEAFKISVLGAKIMEKYVNFNTENVARDLIQGITGLDDKSIINACKLVTFDVWLRNTQEAILAKPYSATNPDKATIENVKILVERGITFFEKYGSVTQDGFSFEPPNPTEDMFMEFLEGKIKNFGGYTLIVDSGDGDFLTKDTMWEFKVSKNKPTSKHTLQLLMYWIMGQHSGQNIFKNITKLGIFNPRLNVVYLLDTSKISKDIIEIVETEVICY